MLLVERHLIDGTPEIIRLCTQSKELYNKCNFLMRQAWFGGTMLPNINTLIAAVKNEDCFKNHETIKGGQSKKNQKLMTITPSNNCFGIKSIRDYKQVVITPKTFGFVVDVQYERESKKEKVSKDKVLCIDIGVNNLATITSGQLGRPILVNGRILKSVNRLYNKHPNEEQGDIQDVPTYSC